MAGSLFVRTSSLARRVLAVTLFALVTGFILQSQLPVEIQAQQTLKSAAAISTVPVRLTNTDVFLELAKASGKRRPLRG